MLRAGTKIESLFDEALPIELRELPDDLARLVHLRRFVGLSVTASVPHEATIGKRLGDSDPGSSTRSPVC
jgi:hypothetical protein